MLDAQTVIPGLADGFAAQWLEEAESAHHVVNEVHRREGAR